MAAAASYTKLKSGEWGIRVQGSVREGEQITVAKKSGESKVETVAKVVWSGNGVTLCAIAQRRSPQRGGGGRDGRWTGCRCGSLEDYPRESDCRDCQHDNS